MRAMFISDTEPGRSRSVYFWVGLAAFLMAFTAGGPSAAHEPGDLAAFRFPYDGEDRGLYAVHPDQGESDQLTDLIQHGMAFDGQTEIAPTGDRVAFDASVRRERSELFVAELDGSEVIELTRGPRADGNPTWSPDGRKIVAECGVPLCLLNADGSGRARMLTGQRYASDTPDWSPNGNRIVFARRVGIKSISPKGDGFRTLTESPTIDLDPMWSPDSRWVLFRRSFGDREVGLMRVMWDGSRLQRLTNEPKTIDREHEWSPDGSQIVFIRSQKPGPDGRGDWCTYLYVMNADGSDERPLTECIGDTIWSIDYPAWSPDGERIAVVKPTIREGEKLTEDVWAVDPNTGDWENLTNDDEEGTYTRYFGLDW